MKRRRFIQSFVAAPVAPLVVQQALAQQSAAPPSAPAAVPQRPVPAAPGGRLGSADAPLQTIATDVAAQPTAPLFLNASQFAALRKLGSLFAPALGGHPGALEAGAPEFLDYLLSVSPVDRQKLYREGLDQLNAQANAQFRMPFADLDATRADAILRPLLSVIPWVEDLPQDPVRHFIAQAQRDFRTATQNSREWAAAGASSGRRGRGFGGGVGLYWLPIDPVKG